MLSAAADTIAHVLRLRRYGLDGRGLDSLLLPFATSPTSLSIAVRPSDYSITLIYERQGIRITRLDRRFRLLTFDSLVSNATDLVSAPQGLWWHDTLRLIWQDNHAIAGGVAEGRSGERALQSAAPGFGFMFGESLPLPHSDISSEVEREGNSVENASSAGDYIAVSPQPARDQVRVDFLLTGSANKVVVMDMLGRVVLERKTEDESLRGSLELDCTGLPGGAYRLLLYTPTRVVSTPLVLE